MTNKPKRTYTRKVWILMGDRGFIAAYRSYSEANIEIDDHIGLEGELYADSFSIIPATITYKV